MPPKKPMVVYTPHAPHPAVTPQLAAFFNTVTPPSLLPSKASRPADPSGRPSAARPMLYSQHGADVSQIAELRIRQWIVQQEQELRKQQHKRLFGS